PAARDAARAQRPPSREGAEPCRRASPTAHLRASPTAHPRADGVVHGAQMTRRWLLLSAASLALGGCAQVLGIAGGGTASPWFCNAHVAAPSGQTTYDFHFVNAQFQPVNPAPVTLCAESDATCAAKTPLTASSGTLQFPLDASYNGYLLLAVPNDPVPNDWGM